MEDGSEGVPSSRLPRGAPFRAEGGGSPGGDKANRAITRNDFFLFFLRLLVRDYRVFIPIVEVDGESSAINRSTTWRGNHTRPDPRGY